MKKIIRLFVLLLALPAILLLTGCGTSGNASVHYSVYAGYGYPYYGYGYGGCCNNNPQRPDRPDRPDKPDRPVNLPSNPDRPSTQPVPRSSAGMGQPSRSQMSRPTRASRGGGRR
jgi:hypothetical protein